MDFPCGLTDSAPAAQLQTMPLGLGHDDPLVRLLAQQVPAHAERIAELEVDNDRLTAQAARQGGQVKRLQRRLEEARGAGRRRVVIDV